MGTAEAPSRHEIREALRGTAYRAIAGMVPPDISTDIVRLIKFTCNTCIGGANGSEEKGSKENDSEAYTDPTQQAFRFAE